ncbi:MAG: S-layer homology domain-containing protein [Clostridia bacterium]|nr:S-layer homology domain-containing protein [Clostridia bacterium]
MKKLFPLLLSFILIIAITPCVSATESMENFKKTNNYAQFFTDVPQSSWYAENVATVYELGLVNGKSETEFVPEGNVTIAESITLAARIYNAYYGSVHTFSQSSPWYQSYVDYAMENGIIKSGQFKNFDILATRSDFAIIMAKALPKKEFNVINNVVHGNIPDIYAYMPCAESVYTLYNAGILSGSDEYGSFFPDSNIKRSEVAAIIARVALRNQRKEFILKATNGNRRVEEMVCIKKDAPQNITNTYINPKTGKETPYETYCSTPEYFEINSTDTIFARILNAATYFPNIIFYDINKNYISGDVKVIQADDRIKYKNMSGVFYEVPENAKYVRYCYGTGFHNNNLEIYIVTHSTESVKPFEGTKILNLGDSLFGNDRTNNISSYLSEYSGATVYNGGLGGTRMTSRPSDNAYEWFDGINLVTALTTGNWTKQTENVKNVPTGYFKETLYMLKCLDMKKIDVVTIAWGTNDYTGKKQLSSIKDGLSDIITMLQKTFPHLKIVVITPVWRYFDNGDANNVKFADATLKEIANGIIDVAHTKNVDVINSYDALEIHDTEHKYFDTGDNTHLNARGNALYAELIYNELKRIYNIR